MKASAFLSVLVLFAVLVSGCMSAPFMPPMSVVSVVSAPLSTEGNWKKGTKKGSAEAMSVLGLVSVGDCSLNAAIDDGDLKEAYYADYEYTNILGIYQKVVVNVFGE